MKTKFPMKILGFLLAVLIVMVMVLAFVPGLAMPVVSDELAAPMALSDGEANLELVGIDVAGGLATYNVVAPVSATEPVLQTGVAVLIFSLTIMALVVVSRLSTVKNVITRYLRIDLEAREWGRRRTNVIMPA